MDKLLIELKQLLILKEQNWDDYSDIVGKIDNHIDDLKEEASDYEDQANDYERDLDDCQCEKRELEDKLDDLQPYITGNQSMDNYFKSKIFEELSEKYTWYQLEEKLKSLL